LTCAATRRSAPHLSRDLLARVDSEEAVRSLEPNIRLLREIEEGFGLIVTAKSDKPDCDFVSRFFAPKNGIDEDPVTGSSHCTLIPFWSERLGKKSMLARQLSKRGGTLLCADKGVRVEIGGTAVIYLEGTLKV
jgi:predicted PhzF superfamily epimerase YddE/YHI9